MESFTTLFAKVQVVPTACYGLPLTVQVVPTACYGLPLTASFTTRSHLRPTVFDPLLLFARQLKMQPP
jgi:hypothetical protein